MDVDDIDRDIERWKRLLKESGNDDEVVHAQLARFLLVHICGRYENAISEMIKSRAEKSGDRPLASYVSQTFRPHRQMSFNEIVNNILAKFGKDHSARFEERVSTDSRGNYNSIITNRNKSAHGQPIRVTLRDIEVWHKGAKEVLRAFEEALAPIPPTTWSKGSHPGRPAGRQA